MDFKKVSVCICLFITITSCTWLGFYKIPSIEGWVVDAQTEKPIQGAVIVVERRLEGGIHSGFAGYLKYQEVITDKNGYFKVPKMGIIYTQYRMHNLSPFIYIFKKGYKNRNIDNVADFDRSGFEDNASLRWGQYSIWDGRTIKLEKFTGTIEEYMKMLFDIANKFNKFDNKSREHRCSWVGVEVPLWYEMLNREMKKNTNDSYISQLINGISQEKNECSKWTKFFKDYSL